MGGDETGWPHPSSGHQEGKGGVKSPPSGSPLSRLTPQPTFAGGSSRRCARGVRGARTAYRARGPGGRYVRRWVGASLQRYSLKLLKNSWPRVRWSRSGCKCPIGESPRIFSFCQIMLCRYVILYRGLVEHRRYWRGRHGQGVFAYRHNTKRSPGEGRDPTDGCRSFGPTGAGLISPVPPCAEVG